MASEEIIGFSSSEETESEEIGSEETGADKPLSQDGEQEERREMDKKTKNKLFYIESLLN